MAEEKNKLDIWIKYFSATRAELSYRGYAVLYRSADASEIPTEVLNVLWSPALFSVAPLQTTLNLVTSTLPAEEVLKRRETGTCGLRS